MKRKIASLSLSVVMLMSYFSGFTVTADSSDAPIGLGDYIQLGTYDTDGDGTAEPILWRCVAFEKITGTDEDGNPITDSTQTAQEYQDGYLPLMLADTAICEKEYDAKGTDTTGSHGRGSDRDRWGSPYWADSNIRDWLNSKDNTVAWTCGNPPSYQDEAGFLTNFTDAEKDVMKTVTQKTLLDEADYNALPEDKRSGSMAMPGSKYMLSDILPSYKNAYSEQVTDTMFLLDVQQLQNVKNNCGDYFRLSSYYWLKAYRWNGTSVPSPRKVSNNDIYYESVYSTESIRPAFYLNTESEGICGSGSASNAIHIMEYRKKIAATPKRDGTKEHWRCRGCGKQCYDNRGTIEIDTVIPAGTQLGGTVQLGEYVQMGTYDTDSDGIAEPILWRCVAFEKVIGTDEDGNPIIDSTQTAQEYQDGYLPLMFADSWVSKGKEFDAAGSGGSHDRDSYRITNGSSNWSDSNIRDWLNSSAAAGNVIWTCGNSPSYKDEAGFLTNFTGAEKAAIKTVTQKSILAKADFDALPKDKRSGSKDHIYNGDVLECPQNYDSAYSEQVTDTIFLLDVQQGKNIYDNWGEYFYKGYIGYCLRTPHTYYKSNGSYDGSYCARFVNSSSLGVVIQNGLAKTTFKVRPAFYLNSQAEIACGTGTVENPYTFVEHSLTYHEAHAATCTESGNSEYWTCDSNDRIFADENAENELNKIPEIAAGHAWNNWEISGNTATRTCARDSAHEETQNVTIEDIADQTYTGSAIEISIIVKVGETVLVKDTDYTVEYQNNINAGTASATIKCKGNYSGEITKEFNIAKATPTVTAPEAKSLTYNGEAQELVTEGATTGGELQYSLDDEIYSTAIPTATDVGSYTVYYKVVGGDNYNDVEAESITVNIEEAKPSLTPTVIPTAGPSASPSTSPTASPTASPSASPSASPTVSPTASPSASPSASPTASPTASPSASPSTSPTVSPTASPSASPSTSPTVLPTASPSVSPSATPTASPTASPSASPETTRRPVIGGIPLASRATPKPTPSQTPAPTAEPDIQPTETEKPSNTFFTDVPENAWYYNSVKYVFENGLMFGVSDTEFMPEEGVTRAMFVTILYRMENEPDISNEILGYPFADLDSDSWYTNAVYWARLNGIAEGYSEDTFAPDKNITREQMAAMVYRYAKFKKLNIETDGELHYADASDISDYAREAVIWNLNNDIMIGDDNKFSPMAYTTRAQAATVFENIVENFK